jgi:hypothetical protein
VRTRRALPGNPSTFSSLHFRSALSSRIAVDLRALAVLRVTAGFLLLADLAYRALDLRAFYTDAGVLPTATLRELSPWYHALSIHAWHGALWYEVALFLLAALAALALAMGYRTRPATILSTMFLFSVLLRQPLAYNAGDTLLLFLLFWGCFLPLGARWSVDAARSARAPETAVVADLASAAILLQVVLIYLVNAAHKMRGGAWWDGGALVIVYNTERYTTGIGKLLADAHGLLALLGQAWLLTLALSFLLLVLKGRARLVIASLFVAAHLAMLLTLRVGLFPLVSVVALLPFLPAPVWGFFERRVAAPLLVSGIGPLLMAWLARQPTRGPAFPVRARPAVRGARAAVIAFVLAVLLLWSALGAGAFGAIGVGGSAKRTLDRHGSGWTMFADPQPYDSWYAAPAELASGAVIDAFFGEPRDVNTPRAVDHAFPDIRWRSYLARLRSAEGVDLVTPLAEYLCLRWNEQHPDDPVLHVDILRMERPLALVDAARGTQVTELGRADCG